MALLELNFKSFNIMKAVRLTIILPCDDGFPSEEPPYKTLYLLNNYSANSSEMTTMMNLRNTSIRTGLAFVLIEGDNSFYIDRPNAWRNYSTFVGEIVELSRRYCPMLSHKREDTFIGGMSMGAWASMYNGIRYHETFSKIAAMSPLVYFYRELDDGGKMPVPLMEFFFGPEETFTGSEYDTLQFLKKANEEGILPKLWMCCAEEDDYVGLDTVPFMKKLQEEDIPGTYIVNHGDHQMPYWSRMLDEVCDFLLS